MFLHEWRISEFLNPCLELAFVDLFSIQFEVLDDLLGLVLELPMDLKFDLIDETWFELVVLLDLEKQVVVSRVDASELKLHLLHESLELLHVESLVVQSLEIVLAQVVD